MPPRTFVSSLFQMLTICQYVFSHDDDAECQHMTFGRLLCGLTEVCCDDDRALPEILLKVNDMHALAYMKTRH